MALPDSSNQQSMLPVGTSIHGKLVIERQLSNGNFGNTYSVRDMMLDKRFALKEFFMSGYTHRAPDGLRVDVSNPQNLDLYNSQLEKFKKEAIRLSALSHPGIVKVYDLFIENDTAYYLMDLVDGSSLQEVTAKRGALPEAEALGYFRQALEALGYVHNQGLFHLDVKPGNMMLETATGVVKLIDFGASKQMSADGGATAGTAAAFTHGYAPAELINGNLDKVGEWTDLYSLGGTLYSLITGTLPPDASDVLNEGEAAFRFPITISPQARQLILWLMKPSYKMRPQSAAEVLAAMGTQPDAPASLGTAPQQPFTPYQPYLPNPQSSQPMYQQPQPAGPGSDFGGIPAYMVQPKKRNPALKVAAILAAVLLGVGAIVTAIVLYVNRGASYLNIDEQYVQVGEEGDFSYQLGVTTDGRSPIHAYSDASWVSTSTGDGVIWLEIEPNYGDEREAQVTVTVDDLKQVVQVTQEASSEPRGVVNKIWVDHNYNRGGVEGMLIHVDFDVHNMRGLTGRAIAWFYKDDGSPIEDTNGSFRTNDGQVSVGENFTPSYDDSNYGDFTLFIPNSELHLPSTAGEGYFVVGLVHDNQHISDNSDKQTFTWN